MIAKQEAALAVVKVLWQVASIKLRPHFQPAYLPPIE
jgi:hypothetical protein